MQYIVIAIWR